MRAKLPILSAPTCCQRVAVHFVPRTTGHPACRARSSTSPFKCTLKNSSASPRRGFTAKTFGSPLNARSHAFPCVTPLFSGAAPPSGVRFAGAPGHAGAVSAASGLHFALLHAARDALRGEGLLASALPVHPEVAVHDLAVHDPPRAEAGEGDPATAVGRPCADAGGEAERRCRRAVGPQDERERERGRG